MPLECCAIVVHREVRANMDCGQGIFLITAGTHRRELVSSFLDKPRLYTRMGESGRGASSEVRELIQARGGSRKFREY